jgi:hypothetical protein
LGIGYCAKLLGCCNAGDCSRLLGIDLYAETRTGWWFAAELRCYVLRRVATLGYCVKLLGSWMLGAVKAGVLCTARALP